MGNMNCTRDGTFVISEFDSPDDRRAYYKLLLNTSPTVPIRRFFNIGQLRASPTVPIRRFWLDGRLHTVSYLG